MIICQWIHFDGRLADGFKVGCEEQTVIIARLTPADPRERDTVRDTEREVETDTHR